MKTIEQRIEDIEARLGIANKELNKLVESEWKIPGWYVWKYNGKTIVFRAIKESGLYLYGKIGEYLKQRCLCFATVSEIEAHLIKEAEKRGFNPGVKFKTLEKSAGCVRTIAGKTDLYYLGSEIILSKKKLPKTKEEFMPFLGEYDDNISKADSLTRWDFLKLYEV